jgi:hypothetical protein
VRSASFASKRDWPTRAATRSRSARPRSRLAHKPRPAREEQEREEQRHGRPCEAHGLGVVAKSWLMRTAGSLGPRTSPRVARWQFEERPGWRGHTSGRSGSSLRSTHPGSLRDADGERAAASPSIASPNRRRRDPGELAFAQCDQRTAPSARARSSARPSRATPTDIAALRVAIRTNHSESTRAGSIRPQRSGDAVRFRLARERRATPRRAVPGASRAAAAPTAARGKAAIGPMPIGDEDGRSRHAFEPLLPRSLLARES